MLANLLFGSSLIALAAAMFFLHRRARRADERDETNKDHLSFSQQQYRRRVWVCLLLAIIGGAIIAGAYMTHPLLAAGYWLCVLLLVVWIGWLALADLLGSRAQLQRLRDEHAAEHKMLQAELARHLPAKQRSRRPNGDFPI